jgi:hypothetical protein
MLEDSATYKPRYSHRKSAHRAFRFLRYTREEMYAAHS